MGVSLVLVLVLAAVALLFACASLFADRAQTQTSLVRVLLFNSHGVGLGLS